MRKGFGFFERGLRRHRPAPNARSASFGSQKHGLSDDRLTEAQEPANDESLRESLDPTRHRSIRWVPPYGKVWLSAAISVFIFAIAVLLFGHVDWPKSIAVCFIAVQTVFVGLGVYWIVRGWRRGWWGIALGGSVNLLPPLVLAHLQLTSPSMYGSAARVMSVRVVDVKDNEPIPGASVRIFNFTSEPGGSFASAGLTSADGMFETNHRFWATFFGTALWHHGYLHTHHEMVEVVAAGYEPVQLPLETIVGPHWDMYGQPIPLIEVRLSRKQ